MKRDSYSFGLKAAIFVLQCVCVGIIVLALLTVNYWLDGTWQFSQLGRSFEETAIFLRDTEDMIRKDVNRSVNETLFTTDGRTDLEKQIDIRQYSIGIRDEANKNENLTYRLSDLINYYPQMSKFNQGLENVLVGQGDGRLREADEIWQALSELSSLEIILPVSGKTLFETASVSQTPFETLLGYYQSLIRTCTDLHDRYLEYEEESQAKENLGSAFVPSNIAYYIENTSTKEVFTNLGVKGVAAARMAISDDPGLTSLFDGVRTMDIMVANKDLTMNEEAATKFIDTIFSGPNERVIIGVNLAYPAGDALRRDYLSCQKLLPLRGFDLIPIEIAAGLCTVAALSWFYLSRMFLQNHIPSSWREAWIIVMAVVEYGILLLSLLSLVRRIRGKSLWHGSVTYMILRVSSQVLEARAASTRMLILYLLFILLNFLFLRYFGTVGIISVIVLDLALLLYLVRDRLGKLSVQAGLRELSKGRLEYRIDTTSLTGDSLEMAQAVNEMGDGLQEAVDSMVSGERLKAELITNVSHDLKTPLTSIISYVDLLKREEIENERAKEYLDILERKSLRLKSLITDLIDVSRISSGNVDLNMTVLDLRSMVQMAAGEFEDRLEQVPLKLSMEAGETLPVRADGDMLWRVLENLLGNIAKYAMPGSTVKIRIFLEDNRAVCTFENRSREILDKSAGELQERFVRGDASRSSEGSGLGLSIARSLTELMGGAFGIRTTPDTFCARLSFDLAGEPDSQI